MCAKKKSTGEITTYERLGQTIVRVRHNASSKSPQSKNQAVQCRRMNNIVALYRAFNSGWKPRYQDKPAGWSDSNAFNSKALQGISIYLTKQEFAQGACILVPLTISSGALPAIGTEFDGVGVVSDISVGDLVATPSTTIAELSRAILYNNNNIRKGDAITFVAGDQQVRPSDGIPVVRFRHCQLDLDTLDTRPLSSLRGSDEAFAVRNGVLASTVSAGACTWVHSRPGQAEQISTQTLWCDNSELIELYHSEAAYEAASQSYGGIRAKGFLAPDPLPDDMAGRL